jgi:hypothetical protein
MGEAMTRYCKVCKVNRYHRIEIRWNWVFDICNKCDTVKGCR